ncbi:MAG: transcription factor E [Methanobacteriaceae archaeon]|nr:transcription factor E [Methanobacteriaceae archaeon]
MLEDPLIINSLIPLFQDKELLEIIQDLIDEKYDDEKISEELGIPLEVVQNLEVIQSLINNIETDEEIAEKTGIKLNIVRKILYKLYDSGIASYKRSKDPETQWYTYAWKFEGQEVSKLIGEYAQQNIEQLQNEIEEEENNMFFVCPHNHCRLNFEEAEYYGFLCPDCGFEMIFQDNKEIIDQIKENIKEWEDLYKKSLN